MPELEKEEQQEEFGWENMSAHDDGSRDMGDILPPEDAEEPTETAPAETQDETDAPDAQEPAAAAAEQQGGEEAAAEGEQKPEDDPVYTLPGGKKVKRSELIADEKLLQNLVTHSNQLTHFQRLSEERQAALEQAEREKREALDQWTRHQMQQQAQQQQPQQQQVQRPHSKQIEAYFEPALQQMVADGRITEDHKQEFGGLIAEYMYDMANMQQLVQSVIMAGSQEITSIRQTIQGD